MAFGIIRVIGDGAFPGAERQSSEENDGRTYLRALECPKKLHHDDFN